MHTEKVHVPWLLYKFSFGNDPHKTGRPPGSGRHAKSFKRADDVLGYLLVRRSWGKIEISLLDDSCGIGLSSKASMSLILTWI